MVFAGNINRLKGILLIAGILSLGAIVLIFMEYGHQAPSDPSDISVGTTATIEVEGFHRDAIIKDGISDWSLDAESATLLLEENKAVMNRMRYTLFNQDGGHVLIEAESGILYTDSNDLEVSGNVMLKNRDYMFLTDTLSYSHERRLIVSRTPVIIKGLFVTGKAKTMAYNLNEGLIYLPAPDKGDSGKNVES